MLPSEANCSCPSGNGSLRWPCVVHCVEAAHHFVFKWSVDPEHVHYENPTVTLRVFRKIVQIHKTGRHYTVQAMVFSLTMSSAIGGLATAFERLEETARSFGYVNPASL